MNAYVSPPPHWFMICFSTTPMSKFIVKWLPLPPQDSTPRICSTLPTLPHSPYPLLKSPGHRFLESFCFNRACGKVSHFIWGGEPFKNWGLAICQYLTLCNPMDYSPPGPFVHGFFQARILEWVAISSSRGSSWARDRTCVSCMGRWILYHWATRKAL